MPNASTLAEARELLAILHPTQSLERERRVDLAITDDGRPRADRAIGVLSDESRPPFDAEQIAVEGVEAANLQEYLESVVTTYAPIGATYITQTANSTLTGEQALSALATGLVKVTTTTGVLSTAAANTDYLPVASPTATGTLTAANLTTTGDNTLGNSATDITLIQGHMKHTGTVPTIAVGAALGTGGSVGATIAGTGHVGELVVTAGTTTLLSGTAATITFATARPDTNYAVLIQPRASNAGANLVGAYATGNTVNDWLLRFSTAPSSGVAYSYYYWVWEWS